MPIYTYRCNQCGHVFEQRQRMSDAPLDECSMCEGSVRRLVNSVGVLFKGNGFYITDNRNGHVNGDGKKEGVATKKDEKTPAAEKSEGAAPAKASESSTPTTT